MQIIIFSFVPVVFVWTTLVTASEPNDSPSINSNRAVSAMQRVEEKLDRAMIAVARDDGSVYLGWRLLKNDPEGITFNVYRATENEPAVKLNEKPLKIT